MSEQGRAEGKPISKPAKPVAAKTKWCQSRCGQGNSIEAKRAATAILEVLAGLRTPSQAAEALGTSVMRYYQVEARGVQGLVSACEARRRGRERTPEKELKALARQQERLQRELGRQQALARMAQRSIGLAAAPPLSASKNGSKKRRRRPTVRGLRMVEQLRQADEEPVAAVGTAEGGPQDN
jgi:hypothetical protein